jgi:hypothetical protein
LSAPITSGMRRKWQCGVPSSYEESHKIYYVNCSPHSRCKRDSIVDLVQRTKGGQCTGNEWILEEDKLACKGTVAAEFVKWWNLHQNRQMFLLWDL